MLHLASVVACLYKPEMNRYYKSVNIVYTNALREKYIYISCLSMYTTSTKVFTCSLPVNVNPHVDCCWYFREKKYTNETN